jgi:ABC-2 type transport system permease protein
MQSSIFYLPGLVGVILQNLTILLTAFAIVRERENGTIEQLNVSPLRRGELIVAKLVPYVIIAYIQVTMILVPAILIFDMPVRGNLLLLLALSSLFIMFSLAIGLLISTVSQNQFQAMQAAFLMLIPSIMLSGFLWPLETMPKLAQWISAVIPLTYYLRILRGIVVRGIGIEYLWQDTIILAAMGVLTLILATSRVHKTLG